MFRCYVADNLEVFIQKLEKKVSFLVKVKSSNISIPICHGFSKKS